MVKKYIPVWVRNNTEILKRNFDCVKFLSQPKNRPLKKGQKFLSHWQILLNKQNKSIYKSIV